MIIMMIIVIMTIESQLFRDEAGDLGAMPMAERSAELRPSMVSSLMFRDFKDKVYPLFESDTLVPPMFVCMVFVV